jgi:hypothetical protein
MPKLSNDTERFLALMDDATNIKYAAAKLAYDKAQIQAWYQSQGLPITKEKLNRLTMLAYNIGWGDPYTGKDLLDNLEKHMLNPEMGGLATLTESLAYQGTLTDDTPISQYHISEMWNNDRMSRVEQALNVACSEWWTR